MTPDADESDTDGDLWCRDDVRSISPLLSICNEFLCLESLCFSLAFSCCNFVLYLSISRSLWRTRRSLSYIKWRRDISGFITPTHIDDKKLTCICCSKLLLDRFKSTSFSLIFLDKMILSFSEVEIIVRWHKIGQKICMWLSTYCMFFVLKRFNLGLSIKQLGL